MTTRNLSKSKRFVFRSADKKSTTYLVTSNESRSDVSAKISSPQAIPIVEVPSQTSTDNDTSRAEVTTPARRVIVIRNTKHAQVNQGSVDLGAYDKTPPVINNGHVSVYFIRRPIASSEPTESAE